MVNIKAPRGTSDILPSETPRWRFVEEQFRETCRLYGFHELRTPTFEDAELFIKHTGESTDIVNKEMYTFTDRGGRLLALRAEGTPPTVRTYLEHNLAAEVPVAKLYYIARIFRYERPQAGRYREHTQFGVEALGTDDPASDAEVMALADHFLKNAGVTALDLKINAIGCPDCRPGYREALQKYAEPFIGELCAACQRRFEQNPLRMLDCKEEKCRKLLADAPVPLDHLDDKCRGNFEAVQESLLAIGLRFTVDPKLVRGFDYYTGTVFEFQSEQLGAQNTVCGGGRYDNLVEEMGGPSTPALGFGLGAERLLLVLKELGVFLPTDEHIDVFVATIGDQARLHGVRLLAELRKHGISGDIDYTGRSLKAQMRLADKTKARFVVILGDEEVNRGAATVRNMETKEQRELPLDAVAASLAG